MLRDSIDKIVTSYFAAVTAEPFTFKGVTYEPRPLTVKAELFRGYTCPPGCGGCCPTFTLDYLPSDPHPEIVEPRFVELSGRAVMVLSDLQADNKGPRCRNLDWSNGRCGIHGIHPFSCDFELIRFSAFPGGFSCSTRLFSRGWNMKRTDGGVGAKCELLSPTPGWADDVTRKMRRLGEWCDHFGMRHRVGTIVEWCEVHSDDPQGVGSDLVFTS
jgi:hypothetical protein